MLKKRGSVITQQYYSHDLSNADLRRSNHKGERAFSPAIALSTNDRIRILFDLKILITN
jgi:hypothetical protein